MTLTLRLIRWCHASTGTLGVLHAGGLKLYTLEPPWRNNERFNSCIPPGRYRLTHHDSPSRGRALLLHDVPDRDAILAHAGNYVHDTEGCILVGESWEVRSQRLAVLNSLSALDTLLNGLAEVPDMYLSVSLYNPYQPEE